jgi:hypothetical protein
VNIPETIEDVLRRLADIESRLASIERGNVYGPADAALAASMPTCICLKQRAGESTGGWYCPRHGQQGVLR